MLTLVKRRMPWMVAWGAIVLAGCENRFVSARDAGDELPEDAGSPAERPEFLERLVSASDFALVQGEAGEVKFLGRVDGAALPSAVLDRPCLFQNTERYAGHIRFLNSLPELADIDFATYLTMVMKRASRVLWGGTLKLLPGEPHPSTGVPGIMAYFLYSDPNDIDALTVDEIAELDARLKSCVPYARDLLVLVGENEDQAIRFEAQRSQLAERGVRLVDLRRLKQGIAAEGYSLGEGYGYLRVVAPGTSLADYGPRDVLVVQGSPQDLALVAGLVTATPQNLHSHVNLRLREKGIPSAFVSDIFQNSVITLLAGRLVHVVVGGSVVSIDPAPLAVAEAFWAARRPPVPPPASDLTITEPRVFSELDAAHAQAFGTKAANLGELHHLLPAANRVEGFAIPFAVYRDLMTATGQQSLLEAFLADPRTASEASFRDAQLTAIAARIEAASVPPQIMARLQDAARAVFGEGFATVPLRFRSSSNAEDGIVLSGAGIYDSARGCFADDLDSDTVGPSACLSTEERQALQQELARRQSELTEHPERLWLQEVIDDLHSDLTKERTAARALKKVYASLWSRRAFEERAYWGIDQLAVYMGIAVHPAFTLERLDGVAVTGLASDSSAGNGDAGTGEDGVRSNRLYRVVSQVGGESVVRPADPSVVAETMLFERDDSDTPSSIRWLSHSSLSPEPLWPTSRMGALAALLYRVHDHFTTAVYPDLENPSLDIELKVTSDDRIVIKQVRPFIQAATSLR